MTAPMPTPPGSLAWYRWFPSDFLAETRGWPALARGLYRELLDAQWHMGALPAPPAELRRIVQYTASEWRRAWPLVERHFPQGGGGRSNPRLEAERREAIARYERRRAAGLRGHAVRWGTGPEASQCDGNAAAELSHCRRNAMATTATATVPTPQQRDQRRTVVVAPRGAAR
jgi:uncharacterized protein YdaU (DUF1376 family)